MLATVLVVAMALLLGTVVMMIGVNQQAAAIAIGDKGVKIDSTEAQEGDPIPDLDVKLGRQPCDPCRFT